MTVDGVDGGLVDLIVCFGSGPAVVTGLVFGALSDIW